MNSPIIILVLLVLSEPQILQCSTQTLLRLKNSQNQESIIQCLQFAFRQGDINLLKQINPLAKQLNKQLLIQKYEEEILRLDILQDDIVLEESKCQPTIKWSQNTTHIFITIKTSHRWDSPPCLHSKNQSSYLNQSYFQYSNTCLVSHSKLNFELKLNLYKDVNINKTQVEGNQILNYQVKNDGVGIKSVILQKQQYKIWPFLNKQQTVYQSWIQIAERYPNDTKSYQQMLGSIIKLKKTYTPKSQLFIQYTIIALAILITL